jgi:transposase
MHSSSAPRRRHSAELKAKILAACDEAGASISGVALAHGLNANLVHKWRRGRGVKLAAVTVDSPTVCVAPKRPVPAAPPLLGANAEFVAIEMPAPPKDAARVAANPGDAPPAAEPHIRVELRRGPLHLNVRWPSSGAEDCRAWLRELTSGLLK